jgi:hypothetical protein
MGTGITDIIGGPHDLTLYKYSTYMGVKKINVASLDQILTELSK